MLTTIQQLEHEIEQFHKNVKDSNELMRILTSVVSATKAHTETFEARTEALCDELEKQLELDRQKNAEDCKRIQEQIKSDAASQQSILLAELKKHIDEHMDVLTHTEQHVVEPSQNLEKKHDAFIAKLESTNMDQIYRSCQAMNKSLNTKFGIVLGGILIAIVVSVLALII